MKIELKVDDVVVFSNESEPVPAVPAGAVDFSTLPQEPVAQS